MIEKTYLIDGDLLMEAISYADSSKSYTSDRHDFHAGGLDNKKQKMFEGKLGEKAVKKFFIENNIPYEEDKTSYDERDEYDFLVFTNSGTLKIDVKTRTENYHTRTLEMVEQANSHPKDIYISARLYRLTNTVKLLGWFTYDEMINIGRIENNGYLDNYVMLDNELHSMEELIQNL